MIMIHNKNTTPDALVSLKNVGLERTNKWLVRGVDMAVHRGEIVTLVGPNGSGKSTTAKTVLGVHKPTEGTITRIKDLRIGYVPQKLSIDWTLPLNVERLMSLTSPVSKTEIKAALEMVNVPHLIKAEVQHLSGGEFQRVLLARAIARKPNLLVLDEPVQGVGFHRRD